MCSFTGCASYKCGDKVFQYKPIPVSTTGKIEKTVGLNILVNGLPEKDRKYTESISNLCEKITAKILEDFEMSGLFTNIHLGSQPGDDIAINGTVSRFVWEYRQNPKTWIPLTGMFEPSGWFTNGTVDISLDLKENKTGTVIGVFQKSSEIKGSYGMYEMVGHMHGDEAEIELTNAFRDVVLGLKQNILVKFNPSEGLENTDEIIRYKKLLDIHVITQEEYDRKKKDLLGL
jgi:hypothetical protein